MISIVARLFVRSIADAVSRELYAYVKGADKRLHDLEAAQAHSEMRVAQLEAQLALLMCRGDGRQVRA